ncbi:TrbC/VirB2 family protein [Bradyrhizobium brasilense]|uniref:TrbC/VirB2 family protein n=1 Tax=Bradyrhizobium brasilense TaxID=1419277 RepID=UPI001E4B754A|nr:TrbC/VirB2 family protein [Bradyrhizobium brasilense]MCC8976895.1 TrbC/VirB2 family protein [Bradyrhizobium brasilense]
MTAIRARVAPYVPLLLIAALFSVVLVEPASAAGLGGIEKVLQTVVDSLTGNVARLIGIIAFVLIGVAWAFGYVDLRTAGMGALGIIIVFSAAEIVDMLKGGT